MAFRKMIGGMMGKMGVKKRVVKPGVDGGSIAPYPPRTGTADQAVGKKASPSVDSANQNSKSRLNAFKNRKRLSRFMAMR
jgi:hypothetical protein